METCNKENMLKWVEALESGKYKQTHGVLSRRGRYCCLGVACEVAIRDGVDLRKYKQLDGTVEYGSCSNFLPEMVKEWLGVDHCNPYVSPEYVVATCANDSLNWSFVRIAAGIRELYRLGPKDKTTDTCNN